MQHLPPPNPDAAVVLFSNPDPRQDDRAAEIRVETVEDQDGEAQGVRFIATTHFRPDDGERKALANGAMVEVHHIGEMLDPETPSRDQQDKIPQMGVFVLGVGSPPDPDTAPAGLIPRALYDQGHVERALGAMFGGLQGASGSIEWTDPTGVARVTDASTFLLAWQEALASTRVVNRDGPSIADMALPSHVRDRLGDS